MFPCWVERGFLPPVSQGDSSEGLKHWAHEQNAGCTPVAVLTVAAGETSLCRKNFSILNS